MIQALLLTLLVAAPADSLLWRNLRENYLGLRSLSGSFEQTVRSEAEGTTQRFSGSFWSVLPDRYRLEVTSPERQVIVAGDSALWFYFPAENRAVREAQPRSMPLLAFLEPVLDPATTARIEQLPDGRTLVHVETEDEMTALQDLRLELSADRRRIEAFEFSDPWGQDYRFILTAQQWNPQLPDATFEFTPPRGTTIE